MRRWIGMIAMIAGASGCASPIEVWREGATKQQTREAMVACRLAAIGSAVSFSATRENDAFLECMTARGYSYAGIPRKPGTFKPVE